MRRVAIYLFCVLSLAGFSAIPASSEEATSPAPTISRWTKFCLGETCFTGADIKNECEALASAVLLEQSGGAKKILRITLPTHVKQENGLSLSIDQAQPIHRPFDPCDPISCSAAYEAGPELVDQLKHGQTLTLSAVDGDNSAIRLTLPLADFAKAYDGPPAQPKIFETQTGQLQKELTARAAGNAPEETPRPHCPPHD